MIFRADIKASETSQVIGAFVSSVGLPSKDDIVWLNGKSYRVENRGWVFNSGKELEMILYVNTK